MSQTVTIPDNVTRMEITINNTTYTYAGGATVEVPDEVAALLANNTPHPGIRPVGDPKNAGIYEGSDFIPVYTAPDGTLLIRAEDAGGGSGYMVLTEDAETGAIDKTWQEVHDAIADGVIPVVMYSGESGATIQFITIAMFPDEEGGDYILRDSANSVSYITDDPDGYPVVD